LAFLRSGTLPLFIILQLCWTGTLQLEACAALILGLNIGIGLFPLERQSPKASVSQLSWAHLLNRCSLGSLVLFFFPYFTQLAALVVPGPPTPALMAFRVAMFHMLLNALMAI